MLANLLIFLSAAVAALTLLDFLMSSDQKKRVSDIVLRIWNWLDEAKRIPILDMVRSPLVRRILSAVLATIVMVLVILVSFLSLPKDGQIPGGDDEGPTTLGDIVFVAAIWLGAALPIIWIGSKIVSIILRGRTAREIALRTSMAFAIACLPVLLVVGIGAIRYGSGILPPDVEVDLVYVLLWFGLGLSIYVTGLLLLFWLIPVTLVLLVYAGSVLLYIAEFTVRRIAEYPKGPVLAASILFGSVVAVIKAFGGG